MLLIVSVSVCNYKLFVFLRLQSPFYVMNGRKIFCSKVIQEQQNTDDPSCHWKIFGSNGSGPVLPVFISRFRFRLRFWETEIFRIRFGSRFQKIWNRRALSSVSITKVLLLIMSTLHLSVRVLEALLSITLSLRTNLHFSGV